MQNPSKKEQTLKLKKLKWDIVNSLTKIAKGPYFLHMDISGLLLGSEALKHIVFEGVAHSKTMLGFHFLENRVNHWTRMQINQALTKAKSAMDARPKLKYVASLVL